MKIEDARVRYNVQIKTYYSKQKELYAQKQKLEEKIKTTENGAEVYKDESAILELQYNAVDEKRQEYQDYMDKLMEQWRMISDKIASKQQSDAMADQAKEMIRRVQQSENYYKALNIISEYVQTELSEKAPVKSRKEKERGDAR